MHVQQGIQRHPSKVGMGQRTSMRSNCLAKQVPTPNRLRLGLSEGLETGDVLTEDQRMHFVRSLVSLY